MKPVVVACNMVTPYGTGVNACWQGIMSKAAAVSPVARFSTRAFHSDYAGIVPDLTYHKDESLVMQMLRRLFAGSAQTIPADARLILASTKGEIDLLEMNILEGRGNGSDCVMDRLLQKVVHLTNARGGGMVLSAACASSSAATARAASLIRNNLTDCALVVGCDSVTEFVFSGFSSLMALDKAPARPFDKNRMGLNVGEAAAYALLMSETRAKHEQRPILGKISGWGLNDDANHMTGPSRESEGLILALRNALRSAGIGPERVGFISAHGTGTVYNDAMEMRAFHAIFGEEPVPVYSIKGGIGHTMGAAGLVEMIIALRALREKFAPPTVNLKEPDADAAHWVSIDRQAVRDKSFGVITNAGFSGINSALVVS